MIALCRSKLFNNWLPWKYQGITNIAAFISAGHEQLTKAEVKESQVIASVRVY